MKKEKENKSKCKPVVKRNSVEEVTKELKAILNVEAEVDVP
jgi:hypothetical protein